MTRSSLVTSGVNAEPDDIDAAPPADEKISSPYSTQPFRVTTREGWVYRFTPDWSPLRGGSSDLVTATKDVRQSPPGQARVVLDFAELDDDPIFGEAEGEAPGRTAPELLHLGSIDLFYELDSSQDNDSGFGCYSGGFSTPFYEAFGHGLQCDYARVASDGRLIENPDPAQSSIEREEAETDRIVSAINTATPVMEISFMGKQCSAWFFPDGTIAYQAEATGHDCFTSSP